MKKVKMLTAVAAAVALSVSVANAADQANMEHCMVVKDGKGMIKEGKGNCKTASHSCAGQNKAGDPQSWISVPAGQCAKINAGDFSAVSADIKDKIEGAR